MRNDDIINYKIKIEHLIKQTNNIKGGVIMTKKEIERIIKGEGSKSSKMKELYNGGLEIKEIANLLGVRYNFVYNVISNECRVNDIELRTNKNRGGKKEEIIRLFKEGKSNSEISKELKTNYQYVYKVVKEVMSTM